jgi:hypothetical protein
MYQDDDKLEDALRISEERQDLEGSLPAALAESDEINSLVHLAAAIRTLPHPQLDAASARSEKRRVLAQANHKKRKRSSLGWSRNGGFTGQWMVLPALAGAAMLLLMVFIVAAGAGIYAAGPRGANAATLDASIGTVEVLDGSGNWIPVSDGQRVKPGQRLRTGADSRVTLTFFEGTQVTMDPQTDLVLSELAGDWGKKLQVVMIQNEGETSHQVVPLQGEESNYSVMTPSGEASVRGTSFKVLVEETGSSVFSVDSGAVLVSNNGEEAFLAAGQGVATELGQPIAAPGFLFALQGEVEDNSGKTWMVEGVPLTVKGGTRITGDPQVGDIVLVNGRITKKHEWIADSIQSPLPGDNGGTFTGFVTGVNDDEVEINGYPFVINDEQPEVSQGDLVRVQFLISGETWVVLNLDLLDDSGVEDPDPDPEPDPEPDPPLETEAVLYFNPADDGVTTCEPVGSFSTSLFYMTDDQEALPLEVSLIVSVEKGGEYLNPVAVSPVSPFTINPNTEVPIMVALELIEGLDGLPPEGEIEISITIRDELSEELIGDTFEFSWECDEELPEEEDSDDDGDKCTREKEHPHARTLADEYGVAVGLGENAYDQIWAWFCEDNLGFGEIELAFKLYLEYGEVLEIDVFYIIDLRLVGGLGWGQIKQELKQAEFELLGEDASDKKVPPGKEKSEEAKNKDKPNKKDK